MAQSQTQVPPPAFSPPPQQSPSPAAPQSAFAPPSKRVRTDAPASQPDSPYANSPYSMSPVTNVTPPGTAGSPPNAPSPALPGQPAPYTNGIATPTLNIPESRPSSTPPVQTPQTPTIATPQFTNATMAPIVPLPAAQTAPGMMGPPQRPAERPTKDYEYDVTDSLAGTGIDLRAEEQFMSDMYSTYFDPEARTGFPQHPSGPKSTFLGAGPANQPAQTIAEKDQNKHAAQAAEKAWMESSMRIGAQRTQEINDPFLTVALLHRRAEKIAGEHHLGLNLDLKNSSQSMGKMKLPHQFNEPSVTVNMNPVGPDQALVQTTGSFIPHDAYLVDQLALMSIATKTRLRELVEDADLIASHRQKTSHGEIPEDWAIAAAPMNMQTPESMDLDGINGNGTPAEGPNSLKRPGDAFNPPPDMPPKKLAKISSHMTTTMRDLAKQEREWEEARLRKRQKRKDGIPDTGATPSRAGSVAPGTPGTPGSVAPESEKPPTKKETKKAQAAKTAEANNHANQNITSSMFAGLGGKGSLFGKKKTGKTYDWMNVGRGGSGASTPSRAPPGLGKAAPGAPSGTPAPGHMAMTTEGRNRLGTWREDKEKGKNIQLRDWISVLERDGREGIALQKAYVHLDASNPK